MAAVPKIQLIYACVLDLYQQAHAKVNVKGSIETLTLRKHYCLVLYVQFVLLKGLAHIT